jgi:molybdate-binding protein
MAFAAGEYFRKRLVLAGCDPATNLLARLVERSTGIEVVPAAASSKLALEWLAQGKVHIAGSHLEDPATGEFNLPYLRRQFPGDAFTVVTFARWEEGFVTAPGNPLAIRAAGDLARAEVRFMNRESGSGSRGLLDQLLKKAGIAAKQVSGYQRVAYGHLAAAYAVASGEADCCLATRSAAQTFGLEFVPLHSERYDFVMPQRALTSPSVQAFLDVLQRASLRRQLETLAGYDTSVTGQVLA